MTAAAGFHPVHDQGRRHSTAVPGNTVLPYRTAETLAPLGTWNVTHPVLDVPLASLSCPLSKLPQPAMGL